MQPTDYPKTLKQKQELFLSSPRYAVIGASKDQTRWATKVLKWYVDRHMDVTPVHPRDPTLQGIPTVRTITELPAPSETSVSIITVPMITLKLLQQANALGVRAVWIQPGAEDAAVIGYIEGSGMADRVIWGGPCVLLEGDAVMDGLLDGEA